MHTAPTAGGDVGYHGIVEATAGGDIAALRSLTKLEELQINDTLLWGSIAALKDLVNLEYLELSDTEIEGDIKHLQNLTNLTTLSLNRNAVAGHISSLASLVNLENLDIAGCAGITGDLVDLDASSNPEIGCIKKTWSQ